MPDQEESDLTWLRRTLNSEELSQNPERVIQALRASFNLGSSAESVAYKNIAIRRAASVIEFLTKTKEQ